MKQNFNINDWLPGDQERARPENQSSTPGENREAVERAIEAIEQQVIDITASYTAWRDIGCAFSHEFGEGGREFFHRVSRFHPQYDPQQCDQQYDRCLRSKGSGIGLGSFFHHVKEAGLQVPASLRRNALPPLEAPASEIELRTYMRPVTEEEPEEVQPEKAPSFPEEIFGQLPAFLKKVVAPARTPEERDLLLLGSMATLSACLPNIYGLYHGKKVYPNLFLFLSAPPSAGKGRLVVCRNLVLPIHRAKREQSRLLKEEYEKALAEYNSSKGEGKEKPVRPPEKMLFIPANNSATGIFQLLFDNNAEGLIFENEADTLTSSFKTEYGNFSDGLRKSFHHETISYFRRTDREYVNLDEPRLSTVLSGTPKQINALIPSAENGLFSRFMFYCMDLNLSWQDVFSDDGQQGLEEDFQNLGEEFFHFHQGLKDGAPMKVVLSARQKLEFNSFFDKVQLHYKLLQPLDYIATVRRLALICYRLCMIFTALRYMEDGQGGKLRQCDQRDFETVVAMARVLVRHSSQVFYSLPESPRVRFRNSSLEQCFYALPQHFSSKEFLLLAERYRIPGRTATRYLNELLELGLIQRERHGEYVLVGV